METINTVLFIIGRDRFQIGGRTQAISDGADLFKRYIGGSVDLVAFKIVTVSGLQINIAVEGFFRIGIPNRILVLMFAKLYLLLWPEKTFLSSSCMC